MDLGPVKSVPGRRSFWADQVAMLGQVDGIAASRAAVLMVDGVRYVALVATDAGRPVYERMGYATTSTHTLLMEKHLLQGH